MIFTTIVLVAFIGCLVWQFAVALNRNYTFLQMIFAAEIIMFAYLAKTLM